MGTPCDHKRAQSTSCSPITSTTTTTTLDSYFLSCSFSSALASRALLRTKKKRALMVPVKPKQPSHPAGHNPLLLRCSDRGANHPVCTSGAVRCCAAARGVLRGGSSGRMTGGLGRSRLGLGAGSGCISGFWGDGVGSAGLGKHLGTMPWKGWGRGSLL